MVTQGGAEGGVVWWRVGLREGSGCGPALPFERDVDGGHGVLLDESSKSGREIGIVGYECKEGVGVVLIGGSGGMPERMGAHMGGQSGRWVLMIAMVPAGGGLKVVRVLLVLGGGFASLVSVGGVWWFMGVVVVREE